MELDGTTVLVVEDDDDTREVMRAMLELCGARVLVAESAKSGLDAYLKDHPDAIVSDIAMPGEDGYWLVREVARHLNTHDVPAVAVTAFAGQHPRDMALAAGFRAHLAKPVDPEVLGQLLSHFPDFRRAYSEDGLTVDEFDSFAPTVRTLRQFIAACTDLAGLVRDVMLPEPA